MSSLFLSSKQGLGTYKSLSNAIQSAAMSSLKLQSAATTRLFSSQILSKSSGLSTSSSASLFTSSPISSAILSSSSFSSASTTTFTPSLFQKSIITSHLASNPNHVVFCIPSLSKSAAASLHCRMMQTQTTPFVVGGGPRRLPTGEILLFEKNADKTFSFLCGMSLIHFIAMATIGYYAFQILDHNIAKEREPPSFPVKLGISALFVSVGCLSVFACWFYSSRYITNMMLMPDKKTLRMVSAHFFGKRSIRFVPVSDLSSPSFNPYFPPSRDPSGAGAKSPPYIFLKEEGARWYYMLDVRNAAKTFMDRDGIWSILHTGRNNSR